MQEKNTFTGGHVYIRPYHRTYKNAVLRTLSRDVIAGLGHKFTHEVEGLYSNVTQAFREHQATANEIINYFSKRKKRFNVIICSVRKRIIGCSAIDYTSSVPRLTIWVSERNQRNGYATQAIVQTIRLVSKEHHIVIAEVQTENEAAKNFFRKIKSTACDVRVTEGGYVLTSFKKGHVSQHKHFLFSQ